MRHLTLSTVTVVVEGNPFSGQSTSVDTILLKPNKFETEKAFEEPFDEIEDFLLNRLVTPKYTADFEFMREGVDGSFYKPDKRLLGPLDGAWNIDIRTMSFETYLEQLTAADDIDDFRSDLISRFLTTGI